MVTFITKMNMKGKCMIKSIFKKSLVQEGKILLYNSHYHPFYESGCVLLLDHRQEGSIGIMINKESSLTVNDALDDFPRIANELNFGGPSDTDTIHFFHRQENLLGRKEVFPGLYWGGDLDLMISWINKGIMDPKKIKFYAGHCHWHQDQLEEEVSNNIWSVTSGKLQDVFSEDPDNLWYNYQLQKTASTHVLTNLPIPSLN